MIYHKILNIVPYTGPYIYLSYSLHPLPEYNWELTSFLSRKHHTESGI